MLTGSHQQICNWYKRVRRNDHPVPPQPKLAIDLSGRAARKPPPLQLYQGYSSRFYKEENVALRAEVEDLWGRREEQDVIDQLEPFTLNGGIPNERMLFHNAVMRWKCSLLTDDERRDLEVWIEDEAQKRWDATLQPWKVQIKGVDELTAENQYTQK